MDAILAGERDPHKLAQLRNRHIQTSEETIIKSLVGDYREQHLFTLRQSLKSYRHYQELIQEVDLQVKQMLQKLPSKIAVEQKPPFAPGFDYALIPGSAVAKSYPRGHSPPRIVQPSPCVWQPKGYTAVTVSWAITSGA
jgi:hypothetical protein